ncbi:thiamine diphosphokinase [Fervidibacillus halotolerans]|uniref:Thiamine diphosphokinase n=1 Tax=Fervidibacillus halotolerans TaxID=2980027 RepID=A0A9E8M264_9BACI|nr:thiamine diphosphokinase [Fervidibacillus halotolerans]WAA13909.1 thiamine diphosphokinase [Fervidibacillus halotolerans]
MDDWTTIHIVAGGPKELIPDLSPSHREGIFWIAVDKGVKYLMDEGIVPNMAVGDFDSISEKEREIYEQTVPLFKIYEKEKDETDLDIALSFALEKKPKIIRIFGATGGRIDHLMANISLLIKPLQINGPLIELIDRQNLIQVKGPGQYVLKRKLDKPYISFIPLTNKIAGLTLKGFKYPLEDRQIPFGSTLCISNELIQEYGTYSFEKGILLVIESSDG